MTQSREERRIVTVLFADLVGSSELTRRVEAEDARLIIGEAIKRSIAIVDFYGGTVKDLAGDGILALFGAPVAHEDDPERALRAGLEIVAAVSEYGQEVSRGWDVPELAARVGVDSGEVVVGQVGAGSHVEYGAVGDAVNTAARLQSQAQPGGILVSDRCRRAVEALFDWGERLSAQLKGQERPVEAHVVLGLHSSSGGTATFASPMVGRQSELRAASDLVDGLAAGRGSLLFVVGEPGIGKSRLAAELRSHAGERECLWLEGRCVSFGEALAYWPFRDMLRGWLGVGPQEPEIRVRLALRRRLAELLGARADELAPYLAALLGIQADAQDSARLAQLSPESLQYRTFEVVSQLVVELARRRTLVIHLDDLHWSDPTSLALVESLLAVAEQVPLLLIVSQRPETEQGSWTLREKAAREYRHLFTELWLKPLDSAQEADLVGALLGETLSPEVAAQAMSLAEGNPLYLEEMVRGLRESGALSAGGRVTVPQTLEGVILARIDRLDTRWRDVLTASSVLGRTFSLPLMEAVVGREGVEARDAVHHLLRLDLLREERRWPEPAYRFKHALIQEAAQRMLLGPQRRDLHGRAASWLEEHSGEGSEGGYGLLAHHWLEAEDSAKAARYLRLAGDRARDEWALDEAITHYRRLVPLLSASGQAQEMAELLFQLGSALILAMRFAEANEAWQQAFAAWSQPEIPASDATATLRVASNQIPWNADPTEWFHTVNMRVHLQTHDSLLRARPGPYVVPGLVESWEVSADGLIFSFRLRQGLTWNDGRPMISADVVWSILHILSPESPSPGRATLFPLRGAEAYALGRGDAKSVGVREVDSRTFELELTNPIPHMLYALSWPGMPLRPDGAPNGPFHLVSMGAEGTVLERDPGYKRRRGGNVGRIEFVFGAGADGLSTLARGEIDALIGSLLTPLPEPGGNTQVVFGGLVVTAFLIFGGGGKRPDVHLRRALAHATDRTLIERRLVRNQSVALGGLVPPGLPGHTPDIAPPFDPDLARQHMAKSRQTGPVVIALAHEHAPAYWDELVASWEQILGITVETRVTSMAEIRDIVDDCDAQHWQWSASHPDPGYFLELLHSDSPTNWGRSGSAALDELIARATRERDGTARLARFHEVDRSAVQEECLVLPLYYWRPWTAIQPWVRGWWEWGTTWTRYDDIVIEESSPRYGPDNSQAGRAREPAARGHGGPTPPVKS